MSGIAHILVLKSLALALVLCSVSPVLVFVPPSAENSMYSCLSVVHFMVKSLNLSLWCSPHPRVPMCVLSTTKGFAEVFRDYYHPMLHISTFVKYRQAQVHQLYWICYPYTTAFQVLSGYLESLSQWHKLLIHDDTEWLSCCIRCWLMLCWNDERVSGSWTEPSFFRTVTKKWLRSLSSFAGGILFKCLVSPCTPYHWYHFLKWLSFFCLSYFFDL